MPKWKWNRHVRNGRLGRQESWAAFMVDLATPDLVLTHHDDDRHQESN